MGPLPSLDASLKQCTVTHLNDFESNEKQSTNPVSKNKRTSESAAKWIYVNIQPALNIGYTKHIDMKEKT